MHGKAVRMNDLSRKVLLAVLEHDGVDEIVRLKAQVRAMRRELVLMKRAWVGPHYSMLTPGCFLLFMEDFTRIIGSSALGTLIDIKMRFAFESFAPDHFATPLESFELPGDTTADRFCLLYQRKRKSIQDYVETTYFFKYTESMLRF